LAKDPRVGEFDLSSLEFVGDGAAPLSAELAVACAKRLGCRTRQGFGMTETTAVTHGVPDDRAGRMPGSIGPALPNTEWRIVDLDSGEELPAGESGELCVRGPQVMKGYLRRARRAVQEGARGRAHRCDPQVAHRQDSATRADRA